jgi:hypothetical protein
VGYPGVPLFTALFMLFQSAGATSSSEGRGVNPQPRLATGARRRIGHELNNQLVAISAGAMLLKDAEKQTFEKRARHAQSSLPEQAHGRVSPRASWTTPAAR